ncbi:MULTISPECIES: GntR family transcriptional regulator [Streptomyces]|uniref:GntR family transcriptional regulator n=2 Tax=Streptomyces TaxID=1883 RepID=A0A380PBT2_STRGR|nr:MULTISPECIES: GntR family transcriptional regulator [Streptomyces]RPK92639.1 putative HTH-type transcriptional regulator YdfH [Streptomyces sp. ADI98-12]GFH71132.1 putative transcriptional regulator, GntR family protein [Streptomyces diastaticus subsp. diastaticus]GGU31902.1 putative transcriptional regulator, GntR family protein [Streptomyces diastaticus subsp. diastaticus]SUP62679.1 GntR family transcriptional regulator [Streptomyces griseus]
MPVPESRGLVSRSLLREEAYRAIRDAIVDGTLAPGERLQDAALVAWLGVSRTPVREALARLEQAGLVRTTPGRHTLVSPLDVRAARDAQSVTAALHELVVRQAVPHLSTAELDAMREANDRFARALRAHDVPAAIAADDAFHGVAVTAAANTAARTVLEQFTPVLRRVERLRFSSLSGRASVAQHARIVERCAAGDAEGAAAATRENWQTLVPLLDRLHDESTAGHEDAPGTP